MIRFGYERGVKFRLRLFFFSETVKSKAAEIMGRCDAHVCRL